MIILKGDKGNIDFTRPLELNELQKERFINFLKEMFYYVEEKKVKEMRPNRIGSKAFSRTWDDEEYELLLKIDETNNSVSRKLGRSWMAINMRRLDFVPRIMQYAGQKGKDVYSFDIKELVRDFLNEHRDEIFKRKEQRKKDRIKEKLMKKEYIRLKEEVTKDERFFEQGLGLMTKEKLEEKKKRLVELEKIYGK